MLTLNALLVPLTLAAAPAPGNGIPAITMASQELVIGASVRLRNLRNQCELVGRLRKAKDPDYPWALQVVREACLNPKTDQLNVQEVDYRVKLPGGRKLESGYTVELKEGST